jgi:hypothetical protein
MGDSGNETNDPQPLHTSGVDKSKLLYSLYFKYEDIKKELEKIPKKNINPPKNTEISELIENYIRITNRLERIIQYDVPKHLDPDTNMYTIMDDFKDVLERKVYMSLYKKYNKLMKDLVDNPTHRIKELDNIVKYLCNFIGCKERTHDEFEHVLKTIYNEYKLRNRGFKELNENELGPNGRPLTKGGSRKKKTRNSKIDMKNSTRRVRN